jgi:membrane associated rhomboid family serine protease
MMFLAPFAPEHAVLRRVPYVASTIILSCLVIHIIVSITGSGAVEEAPETQREIMAYFIQHPHVHLAEDVEATLIDAMSASQNIRVVEYRQFVEHYRMNAADVAQVLSAGPKSSSLDQVLMNSLKNSETAGEMRGNVFDGLMAPPPTDYEVYSHLSQLGPEGEAEEQAHIDRMMGGLNASGAAYQRFGYRPGKSPFYTLVTHAFLHGGWLHLIGNLVFFWFAGLCLESRWGSLFFALFYAVGAVLAALVYAATLPANGTTPTMIGASGAIAATLGAYIVFFARRRVRIAYFFLIVFRPVWGTFMAPAAVVFGLWFVQQLLYTAMAQSSDGVAYAAHAGGFAYGFIVAFVVRKTGLEGRLFNAITEEGKDLSSTGKLDEAWEAVQDGRSQDTLDLLAPMMAKDPRNVQALELSIKARLQQRQSDEAGRSLMLLVESLARSGDTEKLRAAIAIYKKTPAVLGLQRNERIRLAHTLRRARIYQEAAELYASIIQEAGVTPKTKECVLAFAELLVEARHPSPHARQSLEAVLPLLEAEPAWQIRAHALLSALKKLEAQ